MKAMIFSAGMGTRFAPWTDSHPKALALVNGKSLLQRNIEYLQQHGIREIVVNVHHFAEQVIEAIEKNKGWGAVIHISDESSFLLDTGGGLLKAAQILGDDHFATINVDILTDLPLSSMIGDHLRSGSLATLAVMERETTRYLLFNSGGRLCGWRNTADGRERIVLPSDVLVQKAYSGIAVFSPAIFPLIRFTGKFSLIDIYLDLAPDHPLMAYDHAGSKLVDVGTVQRAKQAEKLFR